MATYHVAVPFVLNDKGELIASEGQEKPTANAAVLAAARMAMDAPGAVAFSRKGDPSTGLFADVVVIQSFGEVPTKEALLSALRQSAGDVIALVATVAA